MKRASLLLLVIAAAGCGSSSSSGRGATAAAVSTGVVTTSTSTTTPLVGVHGELTSEPALTGGGALAFLQDGAAQAREIADPSALLAAGLHEGFTLVLDGDALPNAGGRTGLAGAVRVTTFQVDDVATGGELIPSRPPGTSVVFQETGNDLWLPIGPLAPALLASPQGQPLYVTGRAAPNGAVIVTSWRPAVQLSWSNTMPLLGQSSFDVDDLEGTGAYRTGSGLVVFNSGAGGYQLTKGAGRRLAASILTDLRARLVAANLAALPGVFQPPQLYPGNPSTTVRLADAQGEVSVTVMGGSNPPPELADLLQSLGALVGTVPQLRTVAQGDTSSITTAGVEVARDPSAWASLFARHVAPGRPLVPFVDWPQESLVVGVLDGQRPSGGYGVEVLNVVRIGPHLHLPVRRTSPGGAATTVLTAPFHFVAITTAGSTGDLYVEGQKH